MIKYLAIVAVAAAAIGSNSGHQPSAQEIGVGVGPDGVTVGAVRRRPLPRSGPRLLPRSPRPEETVVIKPRPRP